MCRHACRHAYTQVLQLLDQYRTDIKLVHRHYMSHGMYSKDKKVLGVPRVACWPCAKGLDWPASHGMQSKDKKVLGVPRVAC